MNQPQLVTPALLQTMPLPVPVEGGKEARGRVLVVGGSASVPGAVLLSGIAALRAGAGKLQVATVQAAAMPLAIALPEARVIGLPETADGGIAPGNAELLELAARCDALLIGPGLLPGQDVDDLLATLVGTVSGPAIVLDAGALARWPVSSAAMSPGSRTIPWPPPARQRRCSGQSSS